MKLTPLQSSFSAGEITPLMLQRSDTEGYKQGLFTMQNAIPDSRGPAIGRFGNGFLNDTLGDDGRVIEFPVDETFFYSIIFTNLLIEIDSIDGTSLSNIVSPYAEVDLEAIQFIRDPGGLVIYAVHEFYAPYKLIYDPILDIMTWTIVTFTAPPASWTGTNWPSCGDFFEGRLWFGGTKDKPQTFWGSKSGAIEDFTTGTLADDSIVFTMAKFGRIRWMTGFKNLIVGTVYGEHIITSEGGLITPSDISVTQQSSYGSANVQPVQVGDQIFYVSADRTKLRAIQYEWQSDNWLSKDLTFNSEHITISGIKHIVWQQNPDNLFICVLRNGDIATLVYERSNNIYGWSKIQTAGYYLDVASGALDGVDTGVALIQRDTGTIYFETNPFIDSGEFMDAWVSRAPVGVLVSGLGHLEGKVCQVMVDGAVHPDRTVTGGTISLQSMGVTEAIVGLKYTPKLVTLPADDGSNLGSAAAWRKRYNKIFVRILDSALPLVNGHRAPDRNPSTPMDSVEPLVTDYIPITNLGFSEDELITIEQDLPLPFIVLGVFGELGQDLIGQG